MEFDYSRLEGRIIQVFGSKTKYIEKSNTLSRSSLFFKLKNEVPFTDEEMKEAVELLEFDNGVNDIPLYFFTPKVVKTQL